MAAKKKDIIRDFDYYVNLIKKLILAGYSTDKDIVSMDIEKIALDESIDSREIRDVVFIKNAFKSGKPIGFLAEKLNIENEVK